MALSTTELERIADDIYRDRLLTLATYCGDCGYNLKTLPYVHTCPECGNQYNARPLRMTGIFLPHAAEFPVSDLFTALISGGVTGLIGIGAFNPLDVIRLVIGLFFAASTIIFAVQGWDKVKRYAKAIQIIHRIRLEEGEE